MWQGLSSCSFCGRQVWGEGGGHGTDEQRVTSPHPLPGPCNHHHYNRPVPFLTGSFEPSLLPAEDFQQLKSKSLCPASQALRDVAPANLSTSVVSSLSLPYTMLSQAFVNSSHPSGPLWNILLLFAHLDIVIFLLRVSLSETILPAAPGSHLGTTVSQHLSLSIGMLTYRS